MIRSVTQNLWYDPNHDPVWSEPWVLWSIAPLHTTRLLSSLQENAWQIKFSVLILVQNIKHVWYPQTESKKIYLSVNIFVYLTAGNLQTGWVALTIPLLWSQFTCITCCDVCCSVDSAVCTVYVYFTIYCILFLFISYYVVFSNLYVQLQCLDHAPKLFIHHE